MRFPLVLPSCALLLSLASATAVQASESATDCATAVDTLRAGIARAPAEATTFFEGAIEANPECVGPLVSAVIEATGADEAILTSVIRAAVKEYPGKSTEIAGAAMDAAPHAAQAIRAAFFSGDGVGGHPPQPPRSEAPAPLQMKSPIEQFLESQKQEAAPPPAKPGERVLAAISEIDGKIAVEAPARAPNPIIRKPDHIEVSDTSGRFDETTLNDATPRDETEEEFSGAMNLTFRDDGPSLALAFAGPGAAPNAQRIDAVPATSTKPVAAPDAVPGATGDSRDPATREGASGSRPRETPSEPRASVDERPAAPSARSAEPEPAWPALTAAHSVYFIPAPGHPETEENGRLGLPLILRSNPMTPTLPR